MMICFLPYYFHFYPYSFAFLLTIILPAIFLIPLTDHSPPPPPPPATIQTHLIPTLGVDLTLPKLRC